MYEWTTGHNISGDQMYVVPRGGGYDNYGTLWPAECAHGQNTLTVCFFALGFRVVLYVK